MRSILFVSLVLLALTFAACSYVTEFVVVNESERPIEVRYKVKGTPSGFPPLNEIPVKMDASQLGSHKRDMWKELSPDQYRLNQEQRTVTAVLQPHEALLVTSMHHYIGDEDPIDVANWPIDEVGVTGADGGITFTGQKARKSFCYVSRVLYTLTYK